VTIQACRDEYEPDSKARKTNNSCSLKRKNSNNKIYFTNKIYKIYWICWNYAYKYWNRLVCTKLYNTR